MLKPVLRHNRYEYERLNDLKNDVFVGGIVVAFVLMAMLFVFYPAPWLQWVAIPALLALGGVIGVLEIRKTRVFNRDVRERRESGEEG
jgi:hypothetical protein